MTTTVTMEELNEHSGNYDGLCIACGTWTEGGVEPDADGYECPACDEGAVMGAEQAALTKNLEIIDDEENPQ
jgi:hypothetical protein